MVGLDNPIHLALLLVILLLVFGAKRLPEMGRSMGSGLRGFKEAISGESNDDSSAELTSAVANPATTTGPERVETTSPERVETRQAA